jgi:ABC-type multidrug transport system ATPase subunit
LKIAGEIKINGTPVNSSVAIASVSGYVQQEDMFIGYLKVGEQLKFQVYKK